MEVTLELVLRAAKERTAPVTPETAGYIALAIADALAPAPAVVRESDVRLHDNGSVTIVGAQRSADAASAARSVRVVLGKLMQTAGGSSPALSACARNAAGASMADLVAELEAALVPVNRSAARRSIARLSREASRASEAAAPSPPQAPVAKRPGPSDRPAEPLPPRKPAPKSPAPAVAPLATRNPAPALATNQRPPVVPEPAPFHPPAAAPALAPSDATVVNAPVAINASPAPVALAFAPPTRGASMDKTALTPKLATYDPGLSRLANVSPADESYDDPSGPLIIDAPSYGEVVEADIATPSIAIGVEEVKQERAETPAAEREATPKRAPQPQKRSAGRSSTNASPANPRAASNLPELAEDSLPEPRLPQRRPQRQPEFARPRTPKSSMAIMVVLLILCLGLLATLWILHPGIFIGR